MSRTIKQKYRGPRAIDKTCRNHGSCGWCAKGRQYKHNKKIEATIYSLNTIKE